MERGKNISRGVFAILFILGIFINNTYGQVNCTGDTPFFQVDLSNSPNATWLSPAVVRDGECCGGGADQVNCIEVEVTLHPDAVGVLFDVASGADPGGALFYQVNCQGAPISSPTNTICLDGAGPHYISFCKVGNNQNTYSISSIPAASATDNVTSTPSCPDTLSVNGVDPNTITWNSISPGNPGDFNDYLSSLDGTDTGVNGVPFANYDDVIVTPVNGGPTQIMYEVCGTSVGGCDGDPWCDTVVVTIFNDLTLNITPPNPTICFGDNGVDLTANVTGGVPPLSYNWSTGQNTQVINVQAGGTYYVDVTDANGCYFLSDTVVVNEVAQDIVSTAGPDVTVCGVPTPTVNFVGTVTGTNSGEWLDGQGTYVPDNQTLEMSYTPTQNEINNGFVDLRLVSTNTFDCPGDTDIVRINLPTFDTEFDSIISNVSCAGGNDGAIDLSELSGTPIDQFNWSNGEQTQDISGLGAGNYNVDVTDENGCTSDLDFVISEPTPLVIDATNTSNYPSGDNISCFGEADGFITVTASGGTAPYTFEWSNGMVQDSIGGLTAGNYWVTITDDNGCQVSTDVTLTEPDELAVSAAVTSDYNGEDISCYEASDAEITGVVNGGSPNYTVEWTDSDGGLGNNLIMNGLDPDIYTILVEDINGCIDSAIINVTQPDPVEINANVLTNYNGMGVSCEGETDGNISSVANGGTPNYTYAWNTNPVTNTSNLSGVGVGEYIVTLTDANGCETQDTVVLDAHPLPTLSTSLPDEACEGEPVSFSATSDIGETCSWEFENGALFNGFTHNNTYFNDIGCFDVEVTTTSANGCSTTESLANLICINPIPYADFSQSKTDLTTFSPIVQFWNQSNGETSVEWSFGDGNTSQIENPYHEYPTDSSGTYQVQLVAISQYGCTDTVTSLVVIKEELLIFVPNTFTPDNDDYNQIFYPVLTPGFDPYNYELLIFNRWGEIMFESHDATVGWDGTYGGRIVKDGTYLWKIRVKDKYGETRNFKGHVNVLR
tara:strand:- start:30794 stop:33802 length:3009 start_codon:yes stop_codon:yes gene_type:complete